MRLWWVSMSLFMELERSEELVVVSSSFTPPPPPTLGRGTWWTRWSGPSPPPSSCCRWRQCFQCQSGLRRRSQGDPPVPGIAYPWLVVLLLLLFIYSLAKAVSDVNDAMML